jgi:hypothetical protein
VTAPALNWRHTRKRLWRTTDGRYTVVKVKMPSDVPHETFRYVARAIDPAMRQQFPNTVGFPIGIDQPSLAGAQRHAEQHAFAATHDRNVPADYPHGERADFFWPISEGTTRGALVLDRDGPTVTAKIVGMVRGEHGFEPDVYATASIAVSEKPAETVHLGPVESGGVTPCCGRTPFELPQTDRVTYDLLSMTCMPLSTVMSRLRRKP